MKSSFKQGIRPILDRRKIQGLVYCQHSSLPTTSTNSPHKWGKPNCLISSPRHQVESARQAEFQVANPIQQSNELFTSSLRRFSKQLVPEQELHRPKASKKTQHFKGRSGSTCEMTEPVSLTCKNPNNSLFVFNNPRLTSDQILAEIHQQRRKHQSKSPLSSNRASFETLSPKYQHQPKILRTSHNLQAASDLRKSRKLPNTQLVKSAFSIWGPPQSAKSQDQKQLYFRPHSPLRKELSQDIHFTGSPAASSIERQKYKDGGKDKRTNLSQNEESRVSTAATGKLMEVLKGKHTPLLKYADTPPRIREKREKKTDKNKIIDYLDMDDYERFQSLRESSDHMVEYGSQERVKKGEGRVFEFASQGEQTGTFSRQDQVPLQNDLSFSDSLQSVTRMKSNTIEKSQFVQCLQLAIGHFEKSRRMAEKKPEVSDRREMSSIDGHDSGFINKGESPEYDRELEEEMGQKSRNVFLKEEAHESGSLEFNFRDQRGIEIGRSSLSDSAKIESSEGPETEIEYLRSHYQKCLIEFEDVARRYDELHQEHEAVKMELQKSRQRETRFIEQSNQFFRLYEYEHQLNQRNSVIVNNLLKSGPNIAGELLMPQSTRQFRTWRSSTNTRQHSPSFNASSASVAQLFLQPPSFSGGNSPNSSQYLNLSPKQREELVHKMQEELKQKDQEIQLLKENIQAEVPPQLDCQIHSEPSYNPSHRQSFHTLPGYMPQPHRQYPKDEMIQQSGFYIPSTPQPGPPGYYPVNYNNPLLSYSNTTATANKSTGRLGKPPVPKRGEDMSHFFGNFSPETMNNDFTRNNLYTRTPAPLVLNSQDDETMRNTQEFQGAQHHFTQKRSGGKKEVRSKKDAKSQKKEKPNSFLHEPTQERKVQSKGSLPLYSFKQRRGSDK